MSISPEEYQRRWDSHIGELIRLGWHLSGDERERLEALQEELRELLKSAKQDVADEQRRARLRAATDYAEAGREMREDAKAGRESMF